MQPENRFIAAVHRRLPSSVYREKTNNRYRGGTPDVYYEGTGKILWAEYKWLDTTPKRRVSLTSHLSPLQQSWLRRAARNGIQTAVITGTPDGVLLAEDLAWESPLTIELRTKEDIVEWIQNKVGTSPE